MIKFYLLFVIAFSACIHIEKVPSRKNDDGYSSLSFDEKNSIKFSSENISPDSSANIQWINVENFKTFSKKKKNWIIIWASWCPHSVNLLETKYLHYADSLKNEITITPIAQNINLEYQLNILKKIQYNGPLYLINSLEYGTDENTKVRKFLQNLKIADSQIIASTPINILLDEEGKVLKIKYGEKINSDFFSN